MEVTKITVERYVSAPDWTISRFKFDGVVAGYGVEDEKREVKVHGETCIPVGTYKLGFHDSPHFSHEYYRDAQGNLIAEKDRTTAELKQQYATAHEMIQVLDIPNFSDVLWHWGNTDEDTEGCYIVGSSVGPVVGRKSGKSKTGVTGSRVKYTAIYPKIWRSITEAKKNGTAVTVEYKEVPA